MKKGLLIWNIVITIVALLAILGACTGSSLANRVAYLEALVQSQQNDINALKATSSQLQVFLQQQTSSLQDQINQIIVILQTR